MPYTLLSGRGLLRLSGPDTLDFLQGLVSNDVRPLSSGHCVYTAMLSPQGRFLHDFFLMPHDGAVLLDCAESSVDDLRKRLGIYKLRSKVTIEVAGTLSVTAIFTSPSPPQAGEGMVVVPDPRVAALGFRTIGEQSALTAWCAQHHIAPATLQDYERLRISLGVPDGAQDMIFDKSLLMEYGFEELHGVDFNKGCYVGQEVTARSKHRGQVRKFIYCVRAPKGELPAAGMPVYSGDAAIGELRSSCVDIGIAQLRIEEVEKSTSLRCGELAIEATLPPWANRMPQIK